MLVFVGLRQPPVHRSQTLDLMFLSSATQPMGETPRSTDRESDYVNFPPIEDHFEPLVSYDVFHPN